MDFNPFNITFGQKPVCYISRDPLINEIMDDFLSTKPNKQLYILSGIRGCGKTVALGVLANEFEKLDDWIVIRINPTVNIVQEIADHLKGMDKPRSILRSLSVDISIPGLEVHSKPSDEENVRLFIDKSLRKLTKAGKSVLITIDEVTKTPQMVEFISQLQIWLTRDYRIFTLMTGLQENIQSVEADRKITFLYRAPKIILSPLKPANMVNEYCKYLDIPKKTAVQMAEVTKGYSYAFQVLGYLMFKRQKEFEDLILEFDEYMSDYMYSKVWSELSLKDQDVLEVMAEIGSNKVSDIRKETQMDPKMFGVYRSRLIKKGIIFSPSHGCIEFTLPRFREFIQHDVLYLFED